MGMGGIGSLGFPSERERQSTNIAEIVIASIQADTTTREFDAMRSSVDGYCLSCSGNYYNALTKAATVGNVPLIDYIVQMWDRDIVNIRDRGSNTPLYCAATTGQYEAVKRLIFLGADVNAQLYSQKPPYHVRMTTLEAVAYAANNLAIAKLLLANKAIIRPQDPLNRDIRELNAQLFLLRAQREMQEEREAFLSALQAVHDHDAFGIEDIAGIIAGYIDHPEHIIPR